MLINIRPFKPNDLKHVLNIEKTSSVDPWDERDFKTMFTSSRKVTGLIAENHSEIVGYVVFERGKKYSILNMGVAPEHRRKKVAYSLLEMIIVGLSKDKATQISALVSDRQTSAHLFLKSMGFIAKSVESNLYGKGHDAYSFIYNLGSPYKVKNNSKKIKSE